VSTSPLILRRLTEDDAPATALLVNLGAAELVAIETVRERLRAPQPGRIALRLGAFADSTGDQVGYAHALRDEWMPAGLFWLHVVVAQEMRRSDIGSQLFAAVRDFARQHGAATLRGEVREAEPGALAFAEHHGFAIDSHIFESTLALATFDEALFAAAIERGTEQGVRFFTMADTGDTAEARRRLYDLERTVARDIPGGSESTIRPYETFLQQVCDAPEYLADGQIVAADGDTWLGLAAILRIPGASGMYNGITGVLPAYRGRGVSLALKLLAIRTARRHGAAYLRTNNDSQNAPMLAVNRKLGYRPEPGYYRVLATLPPT
jgi:GNAT superfamily N-acetyltransferase